ncbi:MAG: family 10 glycosylhydrolase [Candidatus Omnitrophota bacterium]|nr:family 10 glycosylhydrolase [Candidatus Omnitrophota bacterium]
MKKKFFLIILIFSVAFSAPGSVCSSGAGIVENPRLGVWVTVFTPEKVLYSKDNVDRLISVCKKAGINDVYIQVYRADKAYYNSVITDRSPYEKILSDAGEDTLKYLIDKAGENKIKVHAWINLLSVAKNKDANILKKFSDEIIVLDQHGRPSLREGEKDELDKYYIRENQLFLEPGDSRVRDYLAGIAEEITRKYPGLSGLHLDYVRYPRIVPFVPGSRFTSHGISYGYDEPNIKNFKNASGLDVRTMENSRDNFLAWDNWRRDQVTALVREISERARAISPSLEISATTVPSPEMAYLTTFQQWPLWLHEGYVNYIVAMDYTDDLNLMEINAAALILPDLEKRVHIGIGAYLLKDRLEKLKKQIGSLRRLSPSGVVIFSYDEVAKKEDLQDFLAKNFKQFQKEKSVIGDE